MMSSHEGKTRRHRRWTHVVAFAYRSHHRTSEMLFGVTSNISASGMCLYTDAMLDIGQRIEFKSTLPVSYQMATVKWVKKDVQNLYKIGVVFDG